MTISSVSFTALPLHHQLAKAIAHLGFTQLTPIQSQLLPYTLAGQDAIGKAQTGTGKTATFLITILNDLLNNPITSQRYLGEPRALVLAPTRELAQQITQDCEQLMNKSALRCVCLLGGQDYQQQKQQLAQGFVDVLVATPGRLIDFIQQKEVYLDRVELFVLDEADRMLDMGFIPDIKRIIRHMPAKTQRQSLLFSATFNQDVMNLAYRWLYEPTLIEIEPEQKTSELVEQQMLLVAECDKKQLLLQLLHTYHSQKVIIFANRKDQVKHLYGFLKRQHGNVVMMSGDVVQQKRESYLARFKSGKASILVATDVAGRGIHVDDVGCVINYNLPDNCDDYVHRIGRTGRAGKTGVSISFVSENDAFVLPDLEKHLDCKFELLQATLT